MFLGAYRPIALLSMMANVLSACMAEDLMSMAETHSLLLENHFGCQPGRTASDSVHYISKFTKDMWRKGEVIGALFDTKSASLVCYSIS